MEKVYGSIFTILRAVAASQVSAMNSPGLWNSGEKPWGRGGQETDFCTSLALDSDSQVTLSMVPRKSLLHVSKLDQQAPPNTDKDPLFHAALRHTRRFTSAPAGMPVLGNENVWPLCCPEPRPELCSKDTHNCTFGNTQSSVWLLFQAELCHSALLTDSQVAQMHFWVYKLNYELSIRRVARSVQHFISADFVDADSVPSWTQSTRFWNHHQARGTLAAKMRKKWHAGADSCNEGEDWLLKKNLSQRNLQ